MAVTCYDWREPTHPWHFLNCPSHTPSRACKVPVERLVSSRLACAAPPTASVCPGSPACRGLRVGIGDAYRPDDKKPRPSDLETAVSNPDAVPSPTAGLDEGVNPAGLGFGSSHAESALGVKQAGLLQPRQPCRRVAIIEIPTRHEVQVVLVAGTGEPRVHLVRQQARSHPAARASKTGRRERHAAR